MSRPLSDAELQNEEPQRANALEALVAQLDCVTSTVVRLDRHGRITNVNDAWCKFGRANGADLGTSHGVGLDYLGACRSADDESAQAVAAGIEGVLSGGSQEFEVQYACHSPSQLRWFRLQGTRVVNEGAVVLVHSDVTEHHLALARLKVQAAVSSALATRLSVRESCRCIMDTTGEALEWDAAAVWSLDAMGSLRCVDTWMRPGFAGESFIASMRAFEFTVGTGLPGRVWASCSPEWISDLGKDVDFFRVPWATEVGLVSGFAVPMHCDGEMLAVIEFFSRVRREPERDLVLLLATATLQLGAKDRQVRARRETEAAETAVRRARGQLQALLDCAPAFIVAVDTSRRIQFINRTLPQHQKEDVLGTDFLMYVLPSDRELMNSHFQKTLETGVPRNYDFRMAGPNGEVIQLSTFIGPMREDERVVGAVMVSQDVTQMRHTQAQLVDAQRLAGLGTLAAGVAHEINTPVQFISDSVHFLQDASADVFALVEKLQALTRLAAAGASPAELLEAAAVANEEAAKTDLNYLNERMPKAFERCVDGLERVATIVRSMKDFAHPGQKEMSPVDLNRAIQSTLTVACSEYKYIAELETEFGPLPPVTCFVNDVNQVVLNILVNAAHAISEVVKGTDRKGTIKVSTRTDGEFVIIAISDTGGGIPASIRDRIFDPFFTTKEVGRGTGQGLAMAWAIVKEKHGGALTFETRQGEGTTFFIRVPVDGKGRNP